MEYKFPYPFLMTAIFVVVLTLILYFSHERYIFSKKLKVSKMVLAFYYCWYGSPDGPSGRWYHWNHWVMDMRTGRIVKWHSPDRFVKDSRRDIGAIHYPLLGPYDSNSPQTIRRHLDWAREAGIDGFICSWWGQGSFSDIALGKILSTAEEYNSSLKFTIYYESAGLAVKRSYMDVAEDLKYILDKYAKSKVFLKVDGSPVLFIYDVGVRPISFWKNVIRALNDKGYNPVLIADTNDVSYAEVFDGIHIYNPLGLLLKNRGGKSLSSLYSEMSKNARRLNKIFAATVLPGYDDTAVRDPGKVLDRENGWIYNVTWNIALSANPDMIVICSWNEWHEGSEIEPSVEYGFQYINLTRHWVEKYKNKRN